MAAERKEKRGYVTYRKKDGEYNDCRQTLDLDGYARDVAARIIKEAEQLESEGWKELTLELDEREYSEIYDVFWHGTRMETQAEADKRVENEAKWAADCERRDREAYERLKTQFEEK